METITEILKIMIKTIISIFMVLLIVASYIIVSTFLYRSSFGLERTSLANDTIIYTYCLLIFSVFSTSFSNFLCKKEDSLIGIGKIRCFYVALTPLVLFAVLNITGRICEIKEANKCTPLFAYF